MSEPVCCLHCFAGKIRVTVDGIHEHEDDCDWCNGSGYRRCDDPGCDEFATRLLTERDQSYPLCETHYEQWMEDWNA